MSTSNGSVGTGAILVIGTGDKAFACQPTDITPPGIKRESIKVSHMQSEAHEFIPGKLADYGELKADILFDGEMPDFDEQELLECSLTIPTKAGNKVWTWSGFVTGFDPKVPLEGEMSASITIKVSGKITKSTGGTGN